MTLLMFPLEKLGEILRTLSLSGEIGNVIAILLYVGLCFTPMYLYLFLRKKKLFLTIDRSLIVISGALFVTLYLMINPFYFNGHDEGGILLLCGTFYSFVAGYVTLRVLYQYENANTKRLLGAMKVLLYGLIFLFFSAICVELLVTLPNNLEGLGSSYLYMGVLDLMEQIWGGDSSDRMGMMILILRSFVNLLPYIFNLYICSCGIYALNAIRRDPYSDASVMLVGKIAKVSAKSLKLTILTSAGFNLLQLLCWNCLSGLNISLNVEVTLPILSIAFVLAVMILAKYVGENQKLKRDNELFI